MVSRSTEVGTGKCSAKLHPHFLHIGMCPSLRHGSLPVLLRKTWHSEKQWEDDNQVVLIQVFRLLL